jgi:hypothetical protein
MPLSLKSLVSRLQRTIGDEEGQRIRRAELIDIIEEAIDSVVYTVKLWVNIITLQPRAANETFTVATYNDLAALSHQQNNTALVLDESMRYLRRGGQWIPYPYNTLRIEPENIRMHATLQLWKNGQQAFEKSYQSINTAYSTGYLYPQSTNDTMRDNNGLEFTALRRDDDGFTFTFSTDFQAGDTVTLIYRAEKPIEFLISETGEEVPDVVWKAIYWKSLVNMLENLMMQGDDAVSGRLNYAKKEADSELNNANAYLRNLNNEISTIQVQPIKWLPD